MAPSFNPVSTSGIGFKLEHYVQASFAASLLVETPVPFGNGLHITKLSFQAKLIANADDIIVDFSGPAKYFVQSKMGFEINANETFYEVVEFLWKDFTKQGFDPQNHRFIIATNVLSKADAENGLLVLEWARFSAGAPDFFDKLKSNKQKFTKYKYFLEAIEKSIGGTSDKDLVWQFLRTIYIETFDYLEPGSKDKEVLKWYLLPFIKPGNTAENVLLSLLSYIEECNQHGATLTKSNIDAKIKDLFDLSKSPAVSSELTEFLKKSFSQLQHTIQTEFDGFHIDRGLYLARISESLAEKKIIIISGEGGVGKSALAKEYLEESFKSESGYLVFKADQLDRSSLANTLSDLGIVSDFETILSQWRLLPRLIIYIDSFEKLYESEHKEAFMELLGKVKSCGDNVKIIATCRNFAIETLRTKYRLSKDDIGIVDVPPLTDNQLSEIAKSKPRLKRVIDNPKLCRLISLPFYLNIASQIVDSLSNEDQLDEAQFKKALWELIIEKKGAAKTGVSKNRGAVFSQIVLKRGMEKLPYIKTATTADLETVGELEKDGLLVKHPKMDAYAPAHDIFEDMVIISHLDELFHIKSSSAQFLGSIDSSPVFRRGVRQWTRELILQQPTEAKIFLSEIFPLHNDNSAMVDEILIGILGSDQAYNLIKQNTDLFLKDGAKLFFRAFRLLKLAYTEPYKGGHPERKIKTTGYGWTALVKILDENFETYDKAFSIVLADLLYHWSLQFEPDDILPDEAKIVARYCLQLLDADKNRYSFDSKERLFEILFSVAPQAKDLVEKVIADAVTARKAKSANPGFSVNIYKDLFKMLLVDTFRCVNVYNLFPAFIVELAELEWYNSKTSGDDYDGNYMETSFGLREYPYKYFSASSYQTPFRYLFKYHPAMAFSFLIELCNRGIGFYNKSVYAKQSGTRRLSVTLQDGGAAMLYGDADLWAAYRGIGSSPCLLQSALMAFELYLFEAAATGSVPANLFDEAFIKSNSILLVGVLASVAMAYPLIFEEKILAILKVREFFAWDLSRYTQDFMSGMHTAIGNDVYYTRERRISNDLKHRKTNLEHLTSKLQFYYPAAVNSIIDWYKKNVHPNDHVWQLALARMDMRNTTPEYKEVEQVILFRPNPLPEKLKEYIDEGKDEREEDSTAMTIFLWAQKAFKQDADEPVTYKTWQGNYNKFRTVDFTKASANFDSSKKLAAIGLKYFAEQLTEEEKEYCTGVVVKKIQQILPQLKLGYSHSASDIINDDTFGVLPVLLKPGFDKFISNQILKTYIIDLLLLLHYDIKKYLVSGIKENGWGIDKDFSHQCFQTLLKEAKQPYLYYEIRQIGNLPPEKFTEEVDKRLAAIRTSPEVNAADIEVNTDKLNKLSLAFQAIPYALLNNWYKEYLDEVLVQIADLKNLQDYDTRDFIERIQILVANYLINNSDNNSKSTLLKLLLLHKKQFGFVMGVLKWLVWVGHDNQFPPEFWFHINVLRIYTFTESPTVGFMQVLLLEPLKNVYWCNKIPEINPGRELHELIISQYAADQNLVEPVFKLLAGTGSTYQPVCLVWLMKSLPDQKSYEESLSIVFDTSYITEFANQLYMNHIGHIRMNRNQMDYFIMMLNILADRGSTLAFRIRDELNPNSARFTY